jgi:hypothetical protein
MKFCQISQKIHQVTTAPCKIIKYYDTFFKILSKTILNNKGKKNGF